ncbi:MAG: hypothetical protein Q9225_003766 [Loekoesia sp. 1 TL-2023]
MMFPTSTHSNLVILGLASFILVNPIPLGLRSISASKRASPGYGTLTYTTTGSVIRAMIDNPPINVWDYKLAHDFSSFIGSLTAQTSKISDNSTSVKVVTISSANPDFWIAHYDIHTLSVNDPVEPPGNATATGEPLLRSLELLQTLPIIFIAEINGRVTGAGNELAVQCDIRYAGPRARLSQFEIGFGSLPGAGGVQFLTKLIGRARALEYMLSARAVNAATAAAIGWVNQAFDSEAELRREVDVLARRIASFPAQGLAAVKARVNVQIPSDEDLKGDNDLFFKLAETEVTRAAADRYLKLSDEQSNNEFERGISDDIVQILS